MPSSPLEQRITDLLADLTTAEKLSMLDGDADFWPGAADMVLHDGNNRHPWPAGAVSRLGIDGLHFVDGPRGVVVGEGATTFPAAIARGASFDVDLEQRIGDAMGREARAVGANLLGSVCVNVLRHPGWGRAQESYGEDPVHLAEMGSAAVRGISPHAVACVKHLALNSIESARFRVDVSASPRVLHEVYLPAFRACVDAGAMAVMSAYNQVNGQWCGQNRALLTDVLKQRWGFRGVVLTDFTFGVHDAAAGVNAGLDLEMPFRFVLDAGLPDALAAGEVPTSRIDDAVRRLLRAQLGVATEPADDTTVDPSGQADTASGGSPSPLGSPEHRRLARTSATRSIVLLKNDQVDSAPVLPLADDATLAVIGYLADEPNLGDHGSSNTRPAHVVTPLAGIKNALPGRSVTYGTGDDHDHAAALAEQADVAVVVVGLTWRDEGENIDLADVATTLRHLPPPQGVRRRLPPRLLRSLWPLATRAMADGTQQATVGRVAQAMHGFTSGDRTTLRLDPRDEALVRRVAQANPRTVVVLMGGGAVVAERWRHAVPGIVLLWYPGQEGGHALADVLLGHVAPSGRMPFTVPTDHAHLPRFDPRATKATYDLWHGYRMLARDGNTAAFPFGHGLTYTTFEHAAMGVRVHAEGVTVTLPVTNTGGMDAGHVVHVYVEPPGAEVERPRRLLVGFTRLDVAAGATAVATIDVPWRSLAFFDESADAFVLEAGDHRLVSAPHALADADSTSTLTLERRVVGR